LKRRYPLVKHPTLQFKAECHNVYVYTGALELTKFGVVFSLKYGTNMRIAHYHYHVNIQNDPGRKVNVLGGDSIGNCEKYTFM
jgi:hypothetical protein